MKWFPHMERVETICRLIKSIRPDIKIVLGGNTASQFYTSLIQKDYVDYIIRGDGELPLSELCLGASYIHNAVYKKKGQIVVNPIEYIQDQATSDVYLSNLEDILITPDHLLYMDSAYIYIGKGCSQRCIYCAGHSSVQKQLFS